MSAADENTWDIVPPRRPSLEDCGGATKEDDSKFPPDPVRMPTAAEWNIFAKLIAQLSGLAPSVRLVVSSSGAGSVSASFKMGTAAIAYTVVKNGTGDFSITWPANSFPSPQHAPLAWVTTTGKWLPADAQDITNGVRVKTYDSAGAAANADFIVEEY